jgi:Uncharacterized protein conserved in bacteria (DUF2188)
MSDGIHVMPKGDGWTVTRGNYTLDEFKSQQQALQLAKQRALASKATLHVHGSDGSVQVVDATANENTSESRRKVARSIGNSSESKDCV